MSIRERLGLPANDWKRFSERDHLSGITVCTIRPVRDYPDAPPSYVIACHLNLRDQGQSCVSEVRRIMKLKGWPLATVAFADYEFPIRHDLSQEWMHRVPYRLRPARRSIKVKA